MARDRDKLGAETEVGRCLPIGTVWMGSEDYVSLQYGYVYYTGSFILLALYPEKSYEGRPGYEATVLPKFSHGKYSVHVLWEAIQSSSC